MDKETIMGVFKRILFPVDLTEVSMKIVPDVKEMAKKFNAEVHVLFVLPIKSRETIEILKTQLVQEARKWMNKFITTFFKGASPKVTIACGDPGTEILQYAQLQGIDLIILGSPGQNKVERAAFGSVAKKVRKRSPIPVFTINPKGRAEVEAWMI